MGAGSQPLRVGDAVFAVRGRRKPVPGVVMQGTEGLVISWSEPPVLDVSCDPVSQCGLLNPDQPIRRFEFERRVWLRPSQPLSPGDRVCYAGGVGLPSNTEDVDLGTVIHDGGSLAVRWDSDGIEDRITPDGVAVDFGFVVVRIDAQEG